MLKEMKKESPPVMTSCKMHLEFRLYTKSQEHLYSDFCNNRTQQNNLVRQDK